MLWLRFIITLKKSIKIIQTNRNDIPELYRLQLLAFESEAEMIGSRDVPALQEAEE